MAFFIMLCMNDKSKVLEIALQKIFRRILIIFAG